MKRLISLLLAIALLLSFTACEAKPKTDDLGGSNSSDVDNKKPSSSKFKRTDAELSYDEDAPSLYEAFADWFEVGCAINTWNLNDKNSPEYQTITKHFNVFVLENESKQDAVQRTEGNFNFDAMDKFVEFGEETGATLRGHTLVWHSQCPDWFFFDNGKEASAELVLERMKTHIRTVVDRYKGKIDTWDVVNEVIGDGGGLRDSYWVQRVGDYDGDGDKYDFIEQAFITARECDPDARLIINDYSLESSEQKAISMYLAVKKMLNDGVPIDGIGFQMHIGINTDMDVMRRNFEILGQLRDIKPDFIFEVTELDMSVYNWGDNNATEYTKDIRNQQTQKYRELFEFLIEQSEAGYLDSVVFWGMSDNHSWLNKDNQPNYPMLFAREWKLKDCYWEVLEVAHENTK